LYCNGNMIRVHWHRLIYSHRQNHCPRKPLYAAKQPPKILSFSVSPRPRCLTPSTPSSLDVITLVERSALSLSAYRSSTNYARHFGRNCYYTHHSGQLACVPCDINKRFDSCHRIPLSPHHFPPANQLPFSIPHFFLTSDMTDQTGPSRLHWQVLFEAALQDYEKQTGIVLAKHPLAEQLQNCHSVESVTDVLHEQTQAFSEFRGGDKIMKPLKNTLSVLHKLSAAAKLGQAIGLVRP
jgi:hypothetical protein